MKESYVWAPQAGPQKALVDCPYKLVGFGGARGGGKTDGVLGKYGIKQNAYGKSFNGVFFRQEMPGADDPIDRAKEIYLPLRNSKTHTTYNKVDRQFTFARGGRLRFRPLESDDDAKKYQGQSLSDAAVEEAGNYPDPSPIWKLFGALRSGKNVPTQLILTFNPGGPGHHWLKQHFIKPAPLGMKRLELALPNGKIFNYVYIPSKVGDNRILLQSDPEYIDRLYLVGSPELVRAWLEGDFEIHEGSYFPEFGQRHIVAPFSIPRHWHRYVGYDHGFASPYCALWGAVSSGKDDSGNEVPYPKGSIIIYRESWGKRVDIKAIGERIVDLSSEEEITGAVADPSIGNHQGGPSIEDIFKEVFTPTKFPRFKMADNDRPSGWAQIRMRLGPVNKPDQVPMLYISTACPYLLETLPAQQMDPKNAEDLDTKGEDHAVDALRYLCKERTLDSQWESTPHLSAERGVVRVAQYIDKSRRNFNRPKV